MVTMSGKLSLRGLFEAPSRQSANRLIRSFQACASSNQTLIVSTVRSFRESMRASGNVSVMCQSRVCTEMNRQRAYSNDSVQRANRNKCVNFELSPNESR